MKVLKVLLVLLLAASLSMLMSGAASATDHPWDDSSVDSSHTAGQLDGSTEKPSAPHDDHPIIVKAKDFVIKFLKGFFAWNVGQEEDGEDSEAKATKVKGTYNRTFYKVEARYK